MSYVHNLSPFAIQFTETFGVRWYGLAYLGGFISGYFAILWMTRRGGTRFKIDQISDFITYIAIGVLVGGRLGYALFYAPELFTTVDARFPYWGVLKVNEGGMASHGGIIGVMVVCYLFGRANKISFWHCLDVTVLGSALGFFFGRLANFVNGELYGREADASLRWAVKFPTEMYLWVQKSFDRLPSLGPAVEALGTMKVGDESVTLNTSVWQNWLTNYGPDPLARQRIYETIEALIAAVQAGNLRVTEALAPALTARHPSQLYQAFLEGLLVFILMCWIWRKPQKVGVMCGWFGVLYCLARIVGEQFRMPDAQIGFQWLGLTRGQWLSVGFLMLAIGFLVTAYRRSGERFGGWNPTALK